MRHVFILYGRPNNVEAMVRCEGPIKRLGKVACKTVTLQYE